MRQDQEHTMRISIGLDDEGKLVAFWFKDCGCIICPSGGVYCNCPRPRICPEDPRMQELDYKDIPIVIEVDLSLAYDSATGSLDVVGVEPVEGAE